MNKKLTQSLALLLALLMTAPTAVFAKDPQPETPLTEQGGGNTDDGNKGDGDTAADPMAIVVDGGRDGKIYSNGDYSTAKLSVKNLPKDAKVAGWKVLSGTDVVSVDSEGKLTAKDAGSAKVRASVELNGGEKIETVLLDITVIENTRESVAFGKVKTEYIAGETIQPSDIEVNVTMTDGTTQKVDNFTYTPNTALKATDTELKVVVPGFADPLTRKITVKDISVEDLVKDIAIDSPKANTEYTVGSTLNASDVLVQLMMLDGTKTYNKLSELKGAEVSGDIKFNADGKYTFSDADAKAVTRTLTVKYAGKTASVALKVKAKDPVKPEPEKPDADKITRTVTYSGRLDKTTYKVGETFDLTGITAINLRDNGKTVQTLYPSDLKSQCPTFTDKNIGKHITITFRIPYLDHEYRLEFKDIEVVEGVDDTMPEKIVGIVMNDDRYDVGHKFSLRDIDRLSVELDGSRKTIYQRDFADYKFTGYLELEVLDKDGDRKGSSSRRLLIEESDVQEARNGDKYVEMRLNYKDDRGRDAYLAFEMEVGAADISYIFGRDVITTYEDLEDALKYCNEQDKNVDEKDFDLRHDVDDDEAITLRLGKDMKISSSFDDFSPAHNIIIDLNGHNLEFYSDTIDIDRDDKDYTITIINTSKTESTFTYKDKGIEIKLGEDEKFTFEYDKELPGLCLVEVSVGEHGKVTAEPKLSDNKVSVGMGSSVKFTITPEKDYKLASFKINGKTVSDKAEGYKVSSTGVVTYTLSKIKDKVKVEVTFEKAKKAWENPFRDVSERADYYSAVEFVYTHDLFKGVSSTSFAPNSTMTRAMFVTVLGRLSGMDDEDAARKYGYDSEFADVSKSNGRIKYAIPYIAWATEFGLIQGYGDGNFGPENEITHQQMYLLMYRYAILVENQRVNIRNEKLSMYDKDDVADWAEDGVKYAQQNDFLVYTSGSKIDPKGNATRAELAMLLESFCEEVLEWGDED